MVWNWPMKKVRNPPGRPPNGPSPQPTTKVNKPRRLLASSIPPRRDTSTSHTVAAYVWLWGIYHCLGIVKWIKMLGVQCGLSHLCFRALGISWGAFVRPHWSIIIHDSQECRPVGTQNPMIASEHRDDPIWHEASDQLSKVAECRMENDGKWWKYI